MRKQWHKIFKKHVTQKITKEWGKKGTSFKELFFFEKIKPIFLESSVHSETSFQHIIHRQNEWHTEGCQTFWQNELRTLFNKCFVLINY